MKDGYGRTINYIRISVTDRCNLRCRYCMPAEGVPLISHEEILRYEEIVQICQAAAEQGVQHIRITGGEPLVRSGVAQLVESVKAIPGIQTVTLTTNGILLPGYIKMLVRSGLDGINISLDTMDAAVFAHMTRGGNIEAVLKGIEAAAEYPQLVLKVNCVLNTDWREHVAAVAELARHRPVHVRFIERMPLSGLADEGSGTTKAVIACLESAIGAMTPDDHPLGPGPARYYTVRGFKGQIGLISAISHKFCDSCNRIRLTADGMLRPCLQQEETVDIKTPLRNGCTQTELQQILAAAVAGKPAAHQFGSDRIQAPGMSKIGG